MRLVGIWTLALLICLGIIFIASANEDRECLQYAPPTPTPTPIPLSHIYTEWIPMPGTGPGSGNGWIRASELRKATSTWPPRDILTPHVLRDIEYAAIEKAHGMRQSRGSRNGEIIWGYGFPPRQGFPSLYGGVILKNEWLPERLQSLK